MSNDVPIITFIQKLQKLQLLAEDSFLFGQLRKEVNNIVNELNQILTFLEKENDSSKTLMNQLLKILHSAEYIIESFLVKTTRRRQKGVNKTTKMPLFAFAPWSQLQLIYKMKEIKNKITAVTINFEKVDTAVRPILKGLETPSLPTIRRDTEEELVRRLIKDEEKNLTAISILSNESLGKTALAKKVYLRLDIRQHFQCRVWVHLLEDFTFRDLLLIIMAQIPISLVEDVELMDIDQLSHLLFHFFMEVKFLIVLDNVTSVDVWQKLVCLFADRENSSRVIITTRKADVASQVDPWSDPVCLERLTAEDSWVLFFNKVKVGTLEESYGVAEFSDQLNSVREKILGICHGLPPAIVLLGGVLSTMRVSDWSSVIDHLSHLCGEDHSVPLSNILALSCYRKLPFVLRPCFLYLALFPKMFEIPVRRLLHLWLAEGFVQTSTTASRVIPEDTAKCYLEELVRRNMIEIASKKPDGSPKTCHLPSFLHDVFLSKAEDVGFLHVHHHESDCTSPDSPNSNFVIRRLADQYRGVKSISESHTHNLCSYFLFETQKRNTSNNEIKKLLIRIMNRRSVSFFKVVDLENIYKPVLPDKMGELQNLTYIGLRWTCLHSCPESIGDLPGLETLDLKHTNITTLPNSIWKAKNLRHLYMNEVSILKPSKEPSPHLQTLVGLHISSKDPDEYGLNRLTSLRKLRLTCHSTSVENIVNCISGQLGNLQTVKLRSRNSFGQPLDIVLGDELKEHPSLLKLSLYGVIKNGIDNLPLTLKTLTLSMSQLEEAQMQLLGLLPKLNILSLLACSYSGNEMEFRAGTFQELRVLKLWMLENLEQWRVEEGGLLKLEETEIRGCGKLRSVDGLMHLAALKELLLTNMPPEFLRDDESCSDKLVRNEWKAVSPLLCKRTLLMKDLYNEVMRTEGFKEGILAPAFDYLVENENAAKTFMVNSEEFRRKWLETWHNGGFS